MPAPVTASVADILDRAADLIEPEGAWTQCADARDRRGNPVACDSPRARSFCAVGAINRVAGVPYGTNPQETPSWATRAAFAAVAGEPPMPFNDTNGRTQAEVVAKFREAAAKAREASS